MRKARIGFGMEIWHVRQKWNINIGDEDLLCILCKKETQLLHSLPNDFSNLSSINVCLTLAVKNYGKADTKVLWSCIISLFFFTFSNICFAEDYR